MFRFFYLLSFFILCSSAFAIDKEPDVKLSKENNVKEEKNNFFEKHFEFGIYGLYGNVGTKIAPGSYLGDNNIKSTQAGFEIALRIKHNFHLKDNLFTITPFIDLSFRNTWRTSGKDLINPTSSENSGLTISANSNADIGPFSDWNVSFGTRFTKYLEGNKILNSISISPRFGYGQQRILLNFNTQQYTAYFTESYYSAINVNGNMGTKTNYIFVGSIIDLIILEKINIYFLADYVIYNIHMSSLSVQYTTDFIQSNLPAGQIINNISTYNDNGGELKPSDGFRVGGGIKFFLAKNFLLDLGMDYKYIPLRIKNDMLFSPSNMNIHVLNGKVGVQFAGL